MDTELKRKVHAASVQGLDDALPANPSVEARKAGKVRLDRKMTLEDAFQRIGLNCLEQIDMNAAATLEQDVESLHQMRVGLRRLRALMNMFEALIVPPEQLKEDVDWLAGQLGVPRDWDVFASATIMAVPDIDTADLQEACAAKALELHRQLAQCLRAPRYTRVMLELNGWLRGRQWRIDGVLPGKSPLGEQAARAAQPLLRHAEKRLRKRIEGLASDDAPARHRTRIAAKKARYAAEFFAELLPKKRVHQYIDHLSTLQDRLGELNDIAVADRLLGQLSDADADAHVARQAAYVRGYLAAKAHADADKLVKPMRRIARLRMTRQDRTP